MWILGIKKFERFFGLKPVRVSSNNKNKTGMAQRKRAGLIILRSVVRTHFPVVLTSIALQKLFVIAHAT